VRVIEQGEPIVLSFDGSARRDSTAICAATLDGFIAVVKVWERPERVKDWQVPRDEVNDVIDRMMSGHNVIELACDPPGWQSEIQAWAATYENVLEFQTNVRQRMAEACDLVRADSIEGVLTHDGNPVLAAHVGHCVAKMTPYGTVVTKSHADSPRKIDVAVAAIMG
jgi:phage terminase large subunit-like protein